jgi:Bacteriophage baseplate protein W
MNVDFPYHFDGRRRTAVTDEADHIRDLIEQIIFTTPGERVNRPDFGAGVLQLLFGPASPEAAATAEFMIKGALQQHLGRRVQLEAVTTEAVDATLVIRITYRLARTGEQRTETFEHGGGA